MASGVMTVALPPPGFGCSSASDVEVEPILSGEAAQGMDSDRTLAGRAIRGDAEAFAELYRRYERPIFNFILRCTGSRTLAEELLQETFTRVWRVGSTFDTAHGAFRPWLYKIALNTVRSELRKKRYAVEHVPLEDTEAELNLGRAHDDPAARVDRATQASKLARALESLPPYLKEIVVLRCYQQLKFSEIAEVTGAPEGTLKARFHRAVAELRVSLGLTGRQP